MSRVLIVEDDADIAAAVSDHLHREAIESEQLSRIRPVFDRLRHDDVDVILLDVMLPDGSGFDLCRDLRRAGVTIPIIMLTARNEDHDQVLGLGLGADDYVTKPFSATTLIARIKAQLRRATDYTPGLPSNPVAGSETPAESEAIGGNDRRTAQRAQDASHGIERGGDTPNASARGIASEAPDVVSLGDRVIDFPAGEIRSENYAVDLTAKERTLLSVLVRNANQVFTRDRLFTIVWGDDHFGDPGTVAVHVRRLREKLEDDPSSPKFLQTVRGLGYRFRHGTRPPAEGKDPAARGDTAPGVGSSAHTTEDSRPVHRS